MEQIQPFIIKQLTRVFYRLTRTFQESSIKEEEFAEPYQGDTSPFTILVGDCERPSLAPMTPHSRKHVGMLKLSLKEQLEQLYNN